MTTLIHTRKWQNFAFINLKLLNKLGIEKIDFKIIMPMYKKHVVNNIQNGENLKAFSLRTWNR